MPAAPRKPRSKKPAEVTTPAPAPYSPPEAQDPRWHVTGPMPGARPAPEPVHEAAPVKGPRRFVVKTH